MEEVRNRTRANATNATTPKNASVGSRMVDAVTGVVDAVIGKANKTTTTLPDEIEVIEPVAPASADEPAVVVEEEPVVEPVNASNATVSVNTTNATVSVNATVSANATALNATVSINATNATLPVVNATRANATAVNVTLTPQQRCDYALDFKKFKTQMLAKSKGQNATAAVGTGTQFESVFKTLMDKIRAFEISHSIYELYLGHLQACYCVYRRFNWIKKWTTRYPNCARTWRTCLERGRGGGGSCSSGGDDHRSSPSCVSNY